MSDPVPSLVLDLLEWVGDEPRPYREVLDVWRTSCPRLPVWETATDEGLLEQQHAPGAEVLVAVSRKGREHLHAARPRSASGQREQHVMIVEPQRVGEHRGGESALNSVPSVSSVA